MHYASFKWYFRVISRNKRYPHYWVSPERWLSINSLKKKEKKAFKY